MKKIDFNSSKKIKIITHNIPKENADLIYSRVSCFLEKFHTEQVIQSKQLDMPFKNNFGLKELIISS